MGRVSNDKRFVYVIRSERHRSGHTIDHRPWRLIVAVECADEKTAKRFERYLKSGSGRAFSKRHFAPELTNG
jgi:putative endonuclease